MTHTATPVLTQAQVGQAIAEAVTEYWGERCPNFAPNCCTCRAWQEVDRLTATPPATESRVTVEAIIERCARIADDYADRLEDEAGARIAAAIRSLKPEQLTSTLNEVG